MRLRELLASIPKSHQMTWNDYCALNEDPVPQAVNPAIPRAAGPELPPPPAPIPGASSFNRMRTGYMPTQISQGRETPTLHDPASQPLGSLSYPPPTNPPPGSTRPTTGPGTPNAWHHGPPGPDLRGTPDNGTPLGTPYAES